MTVDLAPPLFRRTLTAVVNDLLRLMFPPSLAGIKPTKRVTARATCPALATVQGLTPLRFRESSSMMWVERHKGNGDLRLASSGLQ